MNRPLQSDAINEITTALVKAQDKIKHAVADSENPHFNSAFASLESDIDATKAALAEQGLVVLQQPWSDEGERLLVTTLAHTSGQWFRSYTEILNEKKNCQSMGSGITYARRYGLEAITNLGQRDDDGNGASAGSVDTSDEKRASEVAVLVGKFRKLKVSEKMLVDKCKVPSVDDISWEQIKELNDIGAKIVIGKRPASEFFRVTT